MENLFEFDNKMRLVPSPEVLTFKCFNKLWGRDTSNGKIKALQELAYIWYMCNQSIKKNPYYEKFANDEAEKSKAIINDIFDNNKYKPDTLVNECISFFKEKNYKETSDTRNALIATKIKLKSWFNDYSPEEDKDGLQLQRNIKSIQELTKAIQEYDSLIAIEEQDDSRITGGGKIGAFEDV